MSCPICRSAADRTYRPFCSARCANIDLGRWLGGAYALPTDETADNSEATGKPLTDTSARH